MLDVGRVAQTLIHTVGEILEPIAKRLLTAEQRLEAIERRLAVLERARKREGVSQNE